MSTPTAMAQPALRKQKTFVIYSNSANQPDSPLVGLNALLEKGWRVAQVHPSNGDNAVYLVVAQESFADDKFEIR